MLSNVMYVLNVISQVYLLDTILDNHFVTLGFEENVNNIFPTQAFCDYEDMVGEAMIVKKIICILPNNSIAKYITVYLWHWYILTFIISVSVVAYDTLFICSETFRKYVLMCKGGKHFKLHFMSRIIENLEWKESVSECLMLTLIFQNLDNDTCLELYSQL